MALDGTRQPRPDGLTLVETIHRLKEDQLTLVMADCGSLDDALAAEDAGAAVGDPSRWPSASQLYRASGLSPAQYESAGRRRDGDISREGSVQLRRVLIDLGVGLWHCDPAAKRYGQALRARGKYGGVIACAMAHRANKIAYAMVRDQAGYDPARWA